MNRLAARDVAALDPYKFVALIGKRLIHAGGRVLATEFLWREPPAEAREVFLGQVCPGLQFDTLDDSVRIYTTAGLGGVETQVGATG